MESFKLRKPDFFCWEPNIYDGIAFLLCLMYFWLEIYLLPASVKMPSIYKVAVIASLIIPGNIYFFGMINLYSDACKYAERPKWLASLITNVLSPVILACLLTPFVVWVNLAALPIIFSSILMFLVRRTRSTKCLFKFTNDKNLKSGTLISLAKNKSMFEADIFLARLFFGIVVLNIVLFSDFKH